MKLKVIKRLFTASIILFVLAPVFGQGADKPAVEVTVTKKKLGINENFVLEYTINLDSENQTLPNLKDFIILSGPNSSTSLQASYVNGRGSMVRQEKINYMLQPKAEGRFTIQPLMIVSGNKKYQSAKVEIEVTKAVDVPRDLNNPNSMAKDNVFLVTRVSNRNPVVGEQIIISYKLLYRMNISQPSVTQFPAFDSFWTERYDETLINDNKKEEYHKNELFQSATFYKVLVVPQKAGVFNIDPMIVRMIVGIQTGRYNWFGEPEIRQARHVVQSDALRMNVSPLPASGKPADFDGAVGQFQLSTKLSSNTANAGESISYSITLEGEGNLKQIELPKIILPDEIESYPPNNKQNLRLTSSGSKGSITEEYLLVPRYKGSYKIPAVSFSYYDTKSRRYKTLTQAQRLIDVLTGEEYSGPAKTQNAGPKQAEKASVNYLTNDISYIEQKTKLSNINKESFVGGAVYSVLFWLAFALIPLALLVKLFDKIRTKDSPESREKRAAKIAKTSLSSAKKALKKKDFAKFYATLEEALYKFALYRLKIQRSEASLENIEELFLKRGVDSSYVKELMSLMDNCHMARYAPQNSSQAEKDYERAFKIIEKLG